MLYKREGGDARAGLESKIMLRAGRSADARAGCPICESDYCAGFLSFHSTYLMRFDSASETWRFG